MPYKNREEQLAAQKRIGKKNYEKVLRVIEAAKSGGCLFCGEKEPICLDFHHLNPEEKDFTIGSSKRHSLERIVAEIAKCAVVCANCHRKLHVGLLSLDHVGEQGS